MLITDNIQYWRVMVMMLFLWVNNQTNMHQFVLIIFLLSISCMVSTLSRVYLTPDGGYKGIVVKIDSQVDEDHCQDIIDNIKVSKNFQCVKEGWRKLVCENQF